ncbi:MAG: SDR family NAD(P)-dependent oxidoreductase [Acidimicrobiia bacterium]
MRDVTGDIQSAVVLGGNSDLASAVIDLLVERRLTRLVLAVRDTDSVHERCAAWRESNVECEVVAYNAAELDSHECVLEQAGDVDAVFVAFGALGKPFDISGADTSEVAELAQLNFGAGVGATHAAARHLQARGHGSLVVFSSVAAIRPRPENAVYGAAKAGLDGFANAMADALHGSGVHVMIVRPGFVRTKMTEGMDEAPFATTPEDVAKDVVAGLKRRSRVVWSPAVLRGVFGGLRILPGPLWRRVIE